MEMFLYVDDKKLSRSLDRLVALMSPPGLSAFLGSTIGPFLSKRAGERFQQEGDDVSGSWEPLKQATIVFRASQGFPPGPINRRTGELENWVVGGGWFSYPVEFGASMSYPKDEPTGRLLEKVETAQKGRRDPSTVARPVLGVNETDLSFFLASLNFAVERAFE